MRVVQYRLVPAQVLAEEMKLGVSPYEAGREHVACEPSHLVTGTLSIPGVVLVVPTTEPPQSGDILSSRLHVEPTVGSVRRVLLWISSC